MSETPVADAIIKAITAAMDDDPMAMEDSLMELSAEELSVLELAADRISRSAYITYRMKVASEHD